MAITPTYSWPLPDDTDLVKDGAEAIRDLGNAIDTTVGGLSGAGLVHIETRTVSASASESFNNVFSATYDNYKIFMNLVGSTTLNLTFRFRVGGSDDSTSNYQNQSLSADSTSISGGRAANQNLGFFAGSVINTARSGFEIVIYEPFATVATGGFSQHIRQFNSATTNAIDFRAFGHNSTTSFDGLTLIPSTGNITGTVRIYGVKN
jgi:hypothetical protein